MKTSEREVPEPPPPPAQLSAESQRLWRDIVPRRARSPERLTLLQTALEALDRANEAAEVIRREGMVSVTETTGAVHMHPLLKVEKDARQLFVRAWRDLGLTWATEIDGRIYG